MEWETVLKCNLCGSSDILDVDKPHNIGRCRDCGYFFSYKRPSRNEVAEYYSRAGRYDDWHGKEWDDLWKRRLSIARRYKSSGYLLDVGTGTGQFLQSAGQYFQVTGTEISESAIAIAKQKYGLGIVKGEIEDLHFERRFDLVTLFHVLEHVHDPSATILRCRSLLSHNGVLLLAVPNDVSGLQPLIFRALSFLKIVGRFRKRGKIGLPKLTLDGSLSEIHLSHFTVPTLKRFLERSGFEVVVETLDPFYAVKGVVRVIHDIVFYSCLLVRKLIGINIYFTILMVAKPREDAICYEASQML
jgi:2-polyprenyl-3-methyl-5-hydroxy-6-metoxy-1,4-benzoquinol methylase